MNSPAVLKSLMLFRHREDIKLGTTMSRFVERMSPADEAWLGTVTDEVIEELATKGFPLYRIYLASVPAAKGGSNVSAAKALKPAEWVMVTFFTELRRALLASRTRTVSDWGLDLATESWLMSASPMDIAAALKDNSLRIASSQGRGGFQACIEARNLANSFLHLLRGVSTPMTKLGHVSRRPALI